MWGSEKPEESFQHSRASQKVNAAAAALLKQTVYRPSRSLLSTTKRAIQDSVQQHSILVKVTTAGRLENNVSQQDGPLPNNHNATRLYLGQDFSQQQTRHG
jgi:hypothetical protein